MNRRGSYGLTALRVVAGGLMAGHGIQKLSRRCGGRGLDATEQGFQAMGFRPARPHAAMAGITEVASGLGWLLGAWTPAASAMATGTMTAAIAKVHGRNGIWITKGGAEYNAVLMAVAFALAASGPGSLAVDGVLSRRRDGLGWALGQLTLGTAAAGAVLARSDARLAREEQAA